MVDIDVLMFVIVPVTVFKLVNPSSTCLVYDKLDSLDRVNWKQSAATTCELSTNVMYEYLRVN